MKTTHLQAKSFHCKDCDKDFDRSDVLMKHKTEVHEGRSLNVCSECRMDFCNPTQLKQHMNKSHLECSGCNKEFSKRANLIAHMKRTVMCSFCSKTFCNQKHLVLHKKCAHNSLQCEKCELLFDQMEKLERHREKHD